MLNVQATFCATLVDEWVRSGVRHAVVSPGSRSTPLALALAAGDRIDVHVHHDERAAAFVALGIGKATGVPALVVTTSGTAAVELHPAVVEASYAGVPLLAVTADRPPELQSVGAPQTIDQSHLYGRAVRWFAEPGVADDATRGSWRPLAGRAIVEATGRRPGPVHLNLAFRDPLVGEPGPLPEGRPDGRPWHQPARAEPSPGGREPLREARGVIVAGAGAGALDVWSLSDATGWPVLAEPTSGHRRDGAVMAFDSLLRHAAFAEAVRPDVVVRVGGPPASKVLAQWLASSGAHQVAVEPTGAWFDPEHTASALLDALPEVDVSPDVGWRQRWLDAERAAQAAIERVLAAHDEATEPFVARTVAGRADGPLVVSSSMPVRDLEWYAPACGRVLANRGANGIDGVVSTAVGVALGTGEPTTCLVGDVAFLHDSNALLGLAARPVDLTIVVVDNRGGGIFSFLPQATTLDAGVFERLFGTPHDVDLVALAAAHGVRAVSVDAAAALAPALDGPRGVRVVVVRSDRAVNVAVHDEVHAAVAAELADVA